MRGVVRYQFPKITVFLNDYHSLLTGTLFLLYPYVNGHEIKEYEMKNETKYKWTKTV